MIDQHEHPTQSRIRNERSNRPLAQRFLADAIAAGEPCVTTMADSMRLTNLLVSAAKSILATLEYLCLRGVGTLRVHAQPHSRRKISITTAWPMLDLLNPLKPKRKPGAPIPERFDELLSGGRKNLFLGHLSSDAERSFRERGALKALGRIGHENSSTALMLNIFDYWFDDASTLGPEPLIEALGLGNIFSDFPIEVTYEKPIPVLGANHAPPRLDLYLGLGELDVGIESKHSEWQDPKNFSIGKVRTAYTNGKNILADAGLPACQELLQNIGRGEVVFGHLDVAQLLAQAAGLQIQATRRGATPVLLYLFLDQPGTAASKEHFQEIRAFQSWVEPEMIFLPASYQELYSRLEKIAGHNQHQAYLGYLRYRYFQGGNQRT